ncbi:MAG: sigma-70 family RNA polymerase sigma factor, partial [Lentisphaeria bacterium]|nr:sigma-70 family RNA polymerase sigma factor [Lentisphaeria bacterium]
YRITVNLARNKFHWNQRRGGGSNISLSQPVNAKNEVTELDTDLPDSRLQPGQQLESDELNANITQGIRKLPGKLRETMMLRHINDYSYEQIASMLDCKIGTVKSRLARGREMLREYLRAIEEGRVPEAFQTHPDDEE